MRLSTLDRYGLRCLVQIGRHQERVGEGLTIPELSRAEGLSISSVAKVMRILRIGGLVRSARGHAGGYSLARPPDQIPISEALNILGGNLFGSSFCEDNAGVESPCPHSLDCSIRSMWYTVQFVVDLILSKISLKDLLAERQELTSCFEDMADEVLQVVDMR